LAGLPQNFQAISNVLANYNFVDIASGTGYINFYAGTTVDLKLLSNFSFDSDIVSETNVNIVHGTANVLLYDHDFDVVLNRPLDISGLGIATVPVKVVFGSGGNHCWVYVIAIVRKWTGAVETDIVSNTSRSQYAVGAATNYGMLSIDLNCPLTHFKKGETLRLTIQLYGSNNDVSADGTGTYAHDPKNKIYGWDSTGSIATTWDTTGAVGSQLMFQCPVRLNL
jgi:hypothetical protein